MMTFTEFLKIEENAEAVNYIRDVMGDAELAFPKPDELATMIDGQRNPVNAAESVAIALEGAALDFRALFEKFVLEQHKKPNDSEAVDPHEFWTNDIDEDSGMTLHPDFKSILDEANEGQACYERYKRMTVAQIVARAIFLEGYVIAITGEPAPDTPADLEALIALSD